MHPGALRALEYDRIVDAVRRLALTPLGRARLAALRPQTDARQVASSLAATSEAVRLIDEGAALGLEAPDDLETILTALAVEGRPLEPAQLLGLARFLKSIETVRAEVRRARTAVPLLRALTDGAASFDAEVTDVTVKIAPNGDVVDEASPELKIIRERLRKQRSRLRSTLESYLRGRETARYLQEQIVTDRNGRYVLVIRAEHRNAIPGIVHGSSTSGASLFLEPLSTVEINNEVVALEQQEQEEVRRILLALADAFRRRGAELHRTFDVATELDALQAKARFSRKCDGIEPTVSAPAATSGPAGPSGPVGGNDRLELRGARHPLLIPAVAELLGSEKLPGPSSGPVPVDVVLIPPTTALVISGPNTGGKTVALKTAGLLPLMAQSGLHVPAAGGTRLPVFRSVFADIGDEQSIAASLSTFSWHMTNIAAMDRGLTLPALVLLDEAGAGTDPAEGGALGVAIVEHFRGRGALVVATTHYDALKTYASTTAGVVCAAFGFDPETFAPSYRLVYGSPGRSLALEIAARLGLPSSIVDTARAQRTAREAQLADHLAKVEHDLNALDHDRRLAARERETLAADSARMQSREEELRRREDVFKRRLDERLDDKLREARREIDEIVRAARERAEVLAARAAQAAPVTTGDSGAVRADARAALDDLADRFRGAPERPPTPPAPADLAAIAAGARVLVGPFGVEGIVQNVHDRDAEVDVRGKRMRVRIDDLRVLAASGAPAARPAVRVNVELQPRSGPLGDLNVIGCTTDEAIARAEKFLDEALVTEQRTVRVIHGHGTGQLRRAIGEFLAQHPLVARYEAAPAEQGGSGVTVVELKE
jgi:DNA mismatch repair protein MutS2